MDIQLDDLYEQYKKLDKGSNISNNVNGSLKDNKWKPSIEKYGIYVLFFVYILLLIIILQPYWLYKKNDETQKYNFLWKRFFLILFLSYGSLLLIFFSFQYYFKK